MRNVHYGTAKIIGHVMITLGLLLGACTGVPEFENNSNPALSHQDLTVQQVRTVSGNVETYDGHSWMVQGDVEHTTCFTQMGCWSVDNTSSVAMQSGALLIIDDECALDADSLGECGPIGVHVACDGTNCQAQKDGQPYFDRWICNAVKADGICRTSAMAFPCPEGMQVSMTGSYPTWAICLTPNECSHDSDCADDGDPCTAETCNNDGQCVSSIAVGHSCSDGNACTTGDTCTANGSCHGTAKDCNDHSVCTADACVDGACVNTVTAGHSCDDNNACTTDSCDAQTGACINHAVEDTTACNDSNSCTTGDECLSGICAGTAKDCNDNNPCTTDSCTNGQCGHESLADGTNCGSGLICLDAMCVEQGNTCTQAGYFCRTLDGVVGYWHCLIAEGNTLGQWQSVEVCGPIATSLCVDGAGGGCITPNSTEGACADQVDNDGDGLVDCNDPDCASNSACLPPAVCTIATQAVDCSVGQQCQGGICIDPGKGLWCWDPTFVGDSVPYCHTHTGGGLTYWSPAKWLWTKNPSTPPDCGAVTGAPVVQARGICCIGPETLSAQWQCFGDERFFPYGTYSHEVQLP